VKISAIVDLDDIFTNDGWDTKMVSSVVQDELRKIVVSELKKALKSNKELQELINKVKSVAIKRALEKVRDLE
jgi:hypothetical protein